MKAYIGDFEEISNTKMQALGQSYGTNSEVIC